MIASNQIVELCSRALSPGHFFLAPGWTFEREYVAGEHDSWEIFQGRLLDRPLTRQRAMFQAWNLFLVDNGVRSQEPLLALKWNADTGDLHVVRGVEAYIHEGYDAGGGVFQTREQRRWLRELVAIVRVGELGPDALRAELASHLFRAVVGASRLPLHSVEAPLPAFSFGKLFYRFRSESHAEEAPLRSTGQLIERMAADWAPIECAKLLEVVLHDADVSRAATLFAQRRIDLGQTSSGLARLLRTLFNEVSLSPWTAIAERTLAFLQCWEEQGFLSRDQVIDFLGHMLRLTARHLTAYDLVSFHHRGANYPDALLLDAFLKAYLKRIDRDPLAFLTSGEDSSPRLRRRALRQAWLLHRRYQGHPVPDMPTSPGEHGRVLPPEYPRVPEEQILQPAKRGRRLFPENPVSGELGQRVEEILQQSIDDLRNDDELSELGMAIYLDRPFGDAKAPAEPDATPLLASEAFSASVAEERLNLLEREGRLTREARTELSRRLRTPPIATGLPLERIALPGRPGTVALTDARLIAGDFLFRRTLPGAIRRLLAAFRFETLSDKFDIDWLLNGQAMLIARSAVGRIAVYDARYLPRLELVDAPGDFLKIAGTELPANGLWVARVFDENGNDLPAHESGCPPIQLDLKSPPGNTR